MVFIVTHFVVILMWKYVSVVIIMCSSWYLT